MGHPVAMKTTLRNLSRLFTSFPIRTGLRERYKNNYFMLLKLDQSTIEEHLSGRSVAYYGCDQTTWFAGYVGKISQLSHDKIPVPARQPKIGRSHGF